MGCSALSHSPVNSEYIFNDKDILYLTQSWRIIKTQNLQKFAHNVLIRTSNQSQSFRRYWRSKIQVEGNNYDYGEHDSCLRNDSSWQVGLQDYSLQFASILDELLSVIRNENHFLTRIQSIDTSTSIFLFDDEPLQILKRCMLENLHECFQLINCNSIDDYELVWNKFLTFFIEHLVKQKNATQMLITPTVKKEEY